jgi:hypothetical protein
VAKTQAILTAALSAARRIKAESDAAAAAAAVAAGKAEKLKKVAGPSGAPSRLNVYGGAGGAAVEYEGDEDDADRHPMYRKKTAPAYDPMLDDSYGKMSRRFNF